MHDSLIKLRSDLLFAIFVIMLFVRLHVRVLMKQNMNALYADIYLPSTYTRMSPVNVLGVMSVFLKIMIMNVCFTEIFCRRFYV